MKRSGEFQKKSREVIDNIFRRAKEKRKIEEENIDIETPINNY